MSDDLVYQAPLPDPHRPEPMPIGMVIKIGSRILRSHWSTLLGVALLLVGPVALLLSAMDLRFYEVARDVIPGVDDGTFDGTLDLTRAEFERLADATWPYLLTIVFAGALGTIAALGFSATVGADYYHRSIDIGVALRACLRRGLSVIGVVVVTSLIIVGVAALGLLAIALALSLLSGGSGQQGGPGAFLAIVIAVVLVVVVVYLTVRWATVVPALAIEDVGWREGLARSWHLTGDNVWRAFAVVLIAFLITFMLNLLLTIVLGGIMGVIISATDVDSAIVNVVVSALRAVLIAPIAAVYLAVLYFDLRTRRNASASGSNRPV